mgnify:CR=1 FL=1
MLERLVVDGVRNIGSAELALGRGLNLIVGANGAGKTSLLEAVHCLARARSFLPGPLRGITKRGQDGWSVRGVVAVEGKAYRLGVGRMGGHTRVRLDGETVGRLSEFAWLLPVQVLNTRSQRLVTDGPSERRGFMNWGVFHVEPSFAGDWRRYERALKQRNAALRRGDDRLAAAWEPEMAAAGERVGEQRRDFLDALYPLWQRWVRAWLPDSDVDWAYRAGWDAQVPLAEQLAADRATSAARGYSLRGPHRADIRLMATGRAAASELSRGQQKLVVTALRFALVELLRDRAPSVDPLLLMDDLPSELDAANQRAVVEAATGLGAQLLVTAIGQASLEMGRVTPDTLFHVEQGQCVELIQ